MNCSLCYSFPHKKGTTPEWEIGSISDKEFGIVKLRLALLFTAGDGYNCLVSGSEVAGISNLQNNVLVNNTVPAEFTTYQGTITIAPVQPYNNALKERI
ncbi:hypothetical protein GCK32_020251 [Trichostrongylus colubriformis]|uniref:Uncharacterized protein n=1 Tax=Trichostrongylus colubriformis TaxID=6319 RepID=A0AAN8F4B2_TRICO